YVPFESILLLGEYRCPRRDRKTPGVSIWVPQVLATEAGELSSGNLPSLKELARNQGHQNRELAREICTAGISGISA
ncbi:hypothetical protein, partial [Rhizobium leguminosarum]|uniref:hypothetical protein n=1 Tax=Rhizobium leguminosarum TaxID=384 RepID=UPI00195462FB